VCVARRSFCACLLSTGLLLSAVVVAIIGVLIQVVRVSAGAVVPLLLGPPFVFDTPCLIFLSLPLSAFALWRWHIGPVTRPMAVADPPSGSLHVAARM
jgi:hypothetical protein